MPSMSDGLVSLDEDAAGARLRVSVDGGSAVEVRELAVYVFAATLP